MASRTGLPTATQLKAMTPENRLKSYFGLTTPDDDRFLTKFNREQCQLREIKRVSEAQTVVTFAFKVDRFYCNFSGNLHGGAQASIFDMLTSIALQAVTADGPWLNAGVTRILTVTYLRPAPEGENVLVDCEVVAVGKRMCLLKAVLKRESDGVVLSTCEHNKASVESKPGFKL